jgi:hypothetical protein
MPDVGAHTTTMTDAPNPRDSDLENLSDIPSIQNAETPEVKKDAQNAPSLDVKAITDRTLQFLATASNETLGACLVGLSAGTYLILGRVGLVLIGVVGGVVLHATWENNSHNGKGGDQKGKNAETRRRELGVDVAHRILDWRDIRSQGKDSSEDDNSDLSLKLYSGKPLDYSEFKPETAAALTELTDAVIRDYVKYVLSASYVDVSNRAQMVVRSSLAFRRNISRLVSPDPDCFYPLHFKPPLPQATSRQLR